MGILYLVIFYFSCSLAASSPSKVISQAHKAASDEPSSGNYINGTMVYEWEPGRIYKVYTKPNRITDIALAPGENIINQAGGDTLRWKIIDGMSGKDGKIRQHVLVKPTRVGISTNLIINTDQRTYHIELYSKKDVPYQASIAWRYEDPKANKMKSISLKKPDKKETPLSGLVHQQLDFNYHFVAKERPSWMPLRVFHDGHKTYIEFPQNIKNEKSPVLYRLNRSKERELINFRAYKNFFIVDFILKIGELTTGGSSSIRVGFEYEGAA